MRRNIKFIRHRYKKPKLLPSESQLESFVFAVNVVYMVPFSYSQKFIKEQRVFDCMREFAQIKERISKVTGET